jgi:signal transduction histidine kinase
MVSNLVRNAIRHSPPGEAVEAAVERIEAEVRIAVRDRGPGIPGDQFPRLFERFYQAFGAERPTGSGLGLSIAQGVAKLHKGRIEVANRPGGGYAFEVMLPQA